MGYNELYLGLTDAYKMEGEPYFNYKRGGYTVEDFKEMDAYAISKGVTLIPNIQTLAHMHFLKRHAIYRDLFDTDEIMLVDDDRVLALVDKMFATMAQSFTTRRIHIGYDEAYGLGTGKYRDLHGTVDKKELLLRHLLRVLKIAEKYGFVCEIWHDMLMETNNTTVTAEDVKKALPENVRVFMWDYFEKDEDKMREKIETLKKHCSSFGFATSIYKCCGFTSRNSFSVDVLLPQMKICAEKGLNDFMVTMWSNLGAQCSYLAALPALFVASEYNNGNYEVGGQLDKAKFKAITGVNFDDLWDIEYIDDPFQKIPKTTGNRSFWIFLTDILAGYYDMLLSEGTNEKYLGLAKRFESVDGGDFSHVFAFYAQLAKVLSIRAELGLKIRKAYNAKDKKALKSLCDNDLTQLIAEMKSLIKEFDAYWLKDNSAYGLEYNHIFFGGLIVRFEHAINRITAYIENDEPIEECEGTIKPSVLFDWNEDQCEEYDYKKFISCGI